MQVRGEVHHDRRLHQLMLSEAESRYDLSAASGFFSSSPPLSTGAVCSDSAGSVHSDLAAAAALATAPSGTDALFRQASQPCRVIFDAHCPVHNTAACT